MKGLTSSGSWSCRPKEDIQEVVAACTLYQFSQQPIPFQKDMNK